MTEHTPGPWVAYHGPMGMDDGLNPFFKGIVAILQQSGGDENTAVTTVNDRTAFAYEANARLIAAAPEMYDALMTIARGRLGDDGRRYDWTPWQQQGADAREIAQAVLARFEVEPASAT